MEQEKSQETLKQDSESEKQELDLSSLQSMSFALGDNLKVEFTPDKEESIEIIMDEETVVVMSDKEFEKLLSDGNSILSVIKNFYE